MVEVEMAMEMIEEVERREDAAAVKRAAEGGRGKELGKKVAGCVDMPLMFFNTFC